MTTQDIERNKEIVRRYAAAFDSADLDTLRALTNSEIFEKTQQMLNGVASMFSDHRIHIQQLIGEDDTVVAKVQSSGQHTGDFMGVPGTGRQWKDNEGVIIYRLSEGVIVDTWNIFNIPMHLNKLDISMSLSA